MDLHYCGGALKNFNLLGKAENCHQQMKYCAHHDKMMAMNSPKDCCDNEIVIVDNLDADYLNAPTPDYGFAVHLFDLPTIVTKVDMEWIPLTQVATEYLNFKPPMPVRSRQILFQSFLF